MFLVWLDPLITKYITAAPYTTNKIMVALTTAFCPKKNKNCVNFNALEIKNYNRKAAPAKDSPPPEPIKKITSPFCTSLFLTASSNAIGMAADPV